MIYKTVFFLVAAFFIQASFSEEDAILAYNEQMNIDYLLHKQAQFMKNEVLTLLDNFDFKIEQLLKAREANQSDPALESSIKVLGAKLAQQATDYAIIENKSLDAAKVDINLVNAVIEYLNKGQ